MISFRCGSCGRVINAGNDKAGMDAVCRWCGAQVVIPDISEFVKGTVGFEGGPDIERGLERAGDRVSVEDEPVSHTICSEGFEGALAGGPITDEAMTGLKSERADVNAADTPLSSPPVDKHSEPAKRLLFWPADAFVYPISKGGLIMMGVLVGMPLACQWVMRLVGMWQCFLMVPFLLLLLMMMFYWFWYSAYCIRDSAAGGVRAPDIVGAAPEILEIMWQWLQMVIAVAVCFVPLFIYLIQRAKAVDDGAVKVEEVGLGTTFWVLMGLGVFLSPMTLLSVVINESLEGLHPFLVVRSILSVLPVYCALICVYALIVYAVIWVMWNWGTPPLAVNVIYALAVYLSLVNCQVMGWFYHRYRETLDWGP